MIIVYGSRLFGRVDEIRGTAFHVATRFGHIMYLPLIPRGSEIIVGKSDDGWQGIPIGTSWKSVMFAWMRVFLLIMAVTATLTGITMVVDPIHRSGSKSGSILETLVASIAFIGLFWGLYYASYRMPFFRYAGFERAMKLAEVGQLPKGLITEIEKAYGRTGVQFPRD